MAVRSGKTETFIYNICKTFIIFINSKILIKFQKIKINLNPPVTGQMDSRKVPLSTNSQFSYLPIPSSEEGISSLFSGFDSPCPTTRTTDLKVSNVHLTEKKFP